MTPALLLARVLRAAADEAERAHAEAMAESRDGIDQQASGLGSRRHCAIVSRRIAEGLSGAWRVGRRHYLSEAALAEERERLSRRKPRAKPKTATVADELRAELRVVGGGR